MAAPQNDVAPPNLEAEVGIQELRNPKLSMAPQSNHP